MPHRIPGCMGNYDFDNIVFFAKKRFIEDYSTIELMKQAKSDREKEEIAIVAMLDLSEKTVTDLRLNCKHAATCKITQCRSMLKKMINEGLNQTNK